MKFSIYQGAVVILSIFFIFNGLRRFLKKEPNQSVVKLLITLLIWVGVLIFTLDPLLARYISKKLDLGENLNTLIFTGFIIIFILFFKLLNIVEKIERNITEIVKSEALKDLENNHE